MDAAQPRSYSHDEADEAFQAADSRLHRSRADTELEVSKNCIHFGMVHRRECQYTLWSCTHSWGIATWLSACHPAPDSETLTSPRSNRTQAHGGLQDPLAERCKLSDQ